jgi:hypothetical protein
MKKILGVAYLEPNASMPAALRLAALARGWLAWQPAVLSGATRLIACDTGG